MLGKPHPEQGLIGERLRTARPKLPGWLLEGVGNGAPRGMIVALSRVTGAGNRTRLTGLSDHLLFCLRRHIPRDVPPVFVAAPDAMILDPEDIP